MKKFFLTITVSGMMAASAQFKYPNTHREQVVEDYHGVKVEDPYRWLEDDNSERTAEWVKAQNRITFDYLNKIPFRQQVRNRLEQLWNYPKYSSPFQKGEWYYFFKNDGLQNQAVMYRQKGLQGEPEEFLNPNTLSREGIAALGGLSFSKSGKYLAYSISMAGSDWQEVYVMDTEKKSLVGDTLRWVKFSGFSWKGEEGFYYSRYPKPAEGSQKSGQNEFHKVYYHKLGTAQEKDELIYEDRQRPRRFHSAGLTEDERFLIVTISEGTSGAEIWFRDLKNTAQKQFKLLIKGFANEATVVDNDGGRLLVHTNIDAPNYKLVSIDPLKPGKENWQTLIAEKEEALESVATGGGYLFVSYLKDASTRVQQFDYKGKWLRDIALPGIGSASGFGGERSYRSFFYTYSSYSVPPAIYQYDIESGVSTLFRETRIAMDTRDFVTEQIFFTSKDGTRVPMFLTYRRGIQLDGTNPVLLYGYGGFNIPMTPGFSISNAFFIEQGGIYAVVNLRGGSEYGERWHKAGMLEKKQNVFDDFIGAAEYLIKAKYTSASKIAIRGGSNGGLLVGAVMTQRPELFRVALPAVGVLDMLRYHKFTIGVAWAVEYGNADSARQFPYLYKYSPYHNLRTGVKYPATLITTGDHDDRVVPAHSFKFAARLQEYNGGDNDLPLLIRIETNAGHGAGKPTSKLIDEAADMWSFTMFHLGMSFDPSGRGNANKPEMPEANKEGAASKSGAGGKIGGSEKTTDGKASTETGSTAESKPGSTNNTTPANKSQQQQQAKQPHPGQKKGNR
jgi:prolyl oligopeptidase